MKYRMIFVLTVVLYISGCTTNEEAVLPAEDVQAIIQQYADQLSTDQNEIHRTRAMLALGTYYSISANSFQLPLDFSVDNLLSVYHAGIRKTEGTVDPAGFDFSGKTGIYCWDAASTSFIRSDDEIDYIQIDFPASVAGQENNVSLRIMKYAENIPAEGTAAEITSFQLELTIDGAPEMSLDYEASYDDLGNPANITVNFLVNPFEMSMDMVQQKGVMQINSIWKKEQNPILSSYFLIAKNNLNFSPYEGLAFAGKTSGFIKYREIKLDGSFDFSSTEIEKADKREAVQMGLYKDSRKLGRLYIDFSTEGARIIPGTLQYFIESMENQVRVPADRLIKPLFDGFNAMI
jgi:hypothetical protein